MNVEKIAVHDIEALRCLFLFMAFDVERDEWVEFGVWEGNNSLDRMYKYYEYLRNNNYYLVGFNNLSYDAQIIEYILRNNHLWWNKSEEEILSLIYQKSQNVINDSHHGLFPPYRENELFVKQIDLFKIAHYDNENKMAGMTQTASLKWLEVMMDEPSVEEMPIPFNQEYMTPEEIQLTIHYCKNDIKSTYSFYKYMRGRVDHDFYKGKDKIQDRIDLINELDLYEGFINYNDVKIGDELNKMTYCKITGKSVQNLYELKRARKPTKKFTFGDCIPEYVKFATEPFIEFYNNVRKQRVNLIGGDQEYRLNCNGTEYVIRKGGIHSEDAYRIVEPGENQMIIDADVGAQYGNSIMKRKLYPKHLGPSWTQVCISNIQKKDYYKQKGKQTSDDVEKRKYKSLETMMKYALAGGLFGKTLERTNWQYAPEVGYFCTIGNQFEILLLIEMLEVAGIHCISSNTDGIVCILDRSLEGKYYEICGEWERIVGNDVNGKLEYQEYTKLIQESVNSYYAIQPDGKVKIKGRLDWEVELHKNNSKDISRIERKALFNYFTKDIPIDHTIKSEKNIYMFCIGVKATKTYRFEASDKEGNIQEYRKIIRYIVTKEGRKLNKRKNAEADTNAVKSSKIAEGFLVTIANQIDEDNCQHLFDNINYEYYIAGAEAVRDVLLRKGKKVKPIDKAQLQLF